MDRDKGDRHMGTTIRKRAHNELCLIAAKNKIFEIFNTEKNTLKKAYKS